MSSRLAIGDHSERFERPALLVESCIRTLRYSARTEHWSAVTGFPSC